jgi:hypothetical protein
VNVTKSSAAASRRLGLSIVICRRTLLLLHLHLGGHLSVWTQGVVAGEVMNGVLGFEFGHPIPLLGVMQERFALGFVGRSGGLLPSLLGSEAILLGAAADSRGHAAKMWKQLEGS